MAKSIGNKRNRVNLPHDKASNKLASNARADFEP